MKTVIVQRPPADRQGPDIISPLITSESIAVARGTAEIDLECSNRVLVSGAIPVQAAILPGTVVAVTDLETGAWRGMLRQFAVTIDRSEQGLTATANVTIERVA